MFFPWTSSPQRLLPLLSDATAALGRAALPRFGGVALAAELGLCGR